MKFSSKPEGVEQMARNNKTTKKVFFRMMGLAIVFAIAAVPAFAGDGGPSTDGKQTFAVDATTALASVSLPGCGVVAGENLAGCATTMRIAGDKTQGNAVCQMDRVYLAGSQQSGACSVAGANKSFGAAPVRVSTNGCNSIYVSRPEGSWAPTVRMRDAEGIAWKLDKFVLRASGYQHTSAGDTWTLETSAGLFSGSLTPIGSWAVFTNGTRSLVMWLNGQLVSTGSCEDGVDAASFKLVLNAVGFVMR